VAYGLVIAVAWGEFARALLDLADLSRLGPGRVAAIVLVGLAVTLVHELGHAFTCKHFGGEVRELGFMLVYLQPAFYCNVNDAWSFPELRARLWVTAAGMWIQMVVAGLAAIVWWFAASGTLLADVMLAAMVAGGLTSVLTNLNPLLPLDGYFALTDWLGIANLRQRGLAWAAWWVRHRLLGLDVPEPAASPREARAVKWYGTLAALYITTMLALLALVALEASARVMGAAGVALVLPWLALVLARPLRVWGAALAQGVRARFGRPGARRRVAWLALVVVALGALPWRARVRGEARTTGVQLADPALAVTLERRARDADSLAADARRARAAGWAGEAARLEAAGAGAAAALRAARARAVLVLRAPVGGVVATARPERLHGRHLAAGDVALALVDADSVEVRVALAGAGAARVRPGQALRVVSRADPSASATVPVVTVAASEAGGGRVEVRARLPRGPAWRPGARAEAQVLLGRTTLAAALWRAMRERVRAEVWL
jgi:hypothetical protein